MSVARKPRMLIRCFGPRSTKEVIEYIQEKYGLTALQHLKAAYDSTYAKIGDIAGALKLEKDGEISDTGMFEVPKVVILEEGELGDDTRLWKYAVYMIGDAYDIYEYKGDRRQGSARSVTEFPRRFIDYHLNPNVTDKEYENGYMQSMATFLQTHNTTTKIMDAATERARRKIILKYMEDISREVEEKSNSQDKYATSDNFWNKMESAMKDIKGKLHRISENIDYRYEDAGYQFDHVIDEIEVEERKTLQRPIIDMDQIEEKKKL